LPLAQQLLGADGRPSVVQQPGTAEVFASLAWQQALGTVQHSLPSSQHAGGVVQQALSSLQQAIPLAQQPGFSSAMQQVWLELQQASFKSQQLSFEGSTAQAVATSRVPTAINPSAID
jgi:hypothetical protein